MKQVKKLYYCPHCFAISNRTTRDFAFGSYCEKSGKSMRWIKFGYKKGR